MGDGEIKKKVKERQIQREEKQIKKNKGINRSDQNHLNMPADSIADNHVKNYIYIYIYVYMYILGAYRKLCAESAQARASVLAVQDYGQLFSEINC